MKARIYTKTGDTGETSLVGGTRVLKSHVRLQAYGTLDELNSVLGLVRANLSSLTNAQLRAALEARLQNVQNQLFNIGSHLACEKAEIETHLPGVKPESLAALEKDMDEWEESLPALKEFILPGGSALASYAHIARTVCRRGEREMVHMRPEIKVDDQHIIYMNRLSDWLFLLARRFNADASIKDITWNKN